MANVKLLSAASILSAAIATPVSAQAAFSEPSAFQAMHPDRDVLNGGALTPAARMGLELPGDAAGGSYASAPVKRISAKHFGNLHKTSQRGANESAPNPQQRRSDGPLFYQAQCGAPTPIAWPRVNLSPPPTPIWNDLQLN